MNNVVREMRQIAETASQNYFDTVMGGKDNYPCGFAWVEVYTVNRGNTRAGRTERALLESMGFRKDSYKGCYTFNNPGGLPVQNMNTLTEGARAAADFLTAQGFQAYSAERMD